MTELRRTLTEDVFYPAHPPRTASALYTQTHHRLVAVEDRPCVVCGVRNSALMTPANRDKAKALETHHALIEWAGANAIDWDKLAADHPDLTTLVALAGAYHAHLLANGTFSGMLDPAIVTKFVDSTDQMLVICLPPDEPVLMADGTERAIASVVIGELVIGGDARPHRVTGLSATEYIGELVEVDGVAMTPDHLVLTNRGWQPSSAVRVGQLINQIRMLGPEMGSVARVQAEILDTIVQPVAVDVMDSFFGLEFTAEQLLQDPTVFHPARPAFVSPDVHAGVSLGRDLPRTPGMAFARDCVEGREPAFVGAVTAGGQSWSERPIANRADDLHREPLSGDMAPHSAASSGTGRDGPEVGRADSERASAGDARLDDPPIAVGVWRPVRTVGRRAYNGVVHDISVAGARSFVSRGLTVHNCDVHHRSAQKGVHMISGPVWELQRYERGDWDFTGGGQR